jgi:23S rRNA A1618 N6-methylase RlmF
MKFDILSRRYATECFFHRVEMNVKKKEFIKRQLSNNFKKELFKKGSLVRIFNCKVGKAKFYNNMLGTIENSAKNTAWYYIKVKDQTFPVRLANLKLIQCSI